MMWKFNENVFWFNPNDILKNTKKSQEINPKNYKNINKNKVLDILNYLKNNNLLSPPVITYNHLLTKIDFEDGLHRTFVSTKLNQEKIPFIIPERDVKNICNLIEGVDFSKDAIEMLDKNQYKIGGEFEWATPVKDTEVPSKKELLIANELSNIIGQPIKISDKLTINPAELNNFRLTRDDSVKSNKHLHYIGSEFVTPPLNYNDFISITKKVFDFINKKNLETNGTTGLHVNISFKDAKKQESVDPLKLVVLSSDEYFRNVWPRVKKTLDDPEMNRNVDYVKSNIKSIKEILSTINIAEKSKGMKGNELADKIKTWLDNEHRSSINKSGTPIWKEKHHAINLGKLSKGYVEFRVMGGADYQNRFSEFEQTLHKFLLLMDYSSNPEEQKKEYLKKLYKIFSSILDDLEFIGYDENWKREQEKILPNVNIKSKKALDILERGALLYSEFPKMKKRFYEFAYLFENKSKQGGIYAILSLLNERSSIAQISKYKNTIRSLLIFLLKEYNVSKQDIINVYNKFYYEPNRVPEDDEDFDETKTVHSLTLDKILNILGY